MSFWLYGFEVLCYRAVNNRTRRRVKRFEAEAKQGTFDGLTRDEILLQKTGIREIENDSI